MRCGKPLRGIYIGREMSGACVVGESPIGMKVSYMFNVLLQMWMWTVATPSCKVRGTCTRPVHGLYVPDMSH